MKIKINAQIRSEEKHELRASPLDSRTFSSCNANSQRWRLIPSLIQLTPSTFLAEVVNLNFHAAAEPLEKQFYECGHLTIWMAWALRYMRSRDPLKKHCYRNKTAKKERAGGLQKGTDTQSIILHSTQMSAGLKARASIWIWVDV